MPESEQDNIYSMALSDYFLDVAKLNEIGRSIKNGQHVRLTIKQEDLLRPAARDDLKMYAPMIAGAKMETSLMDKQIAQKVGYRSNPDPSNRLRHLAAGQGPLSGPVHNTCEKVS